jgi:hypothetical protein
MVIERTHRDAFAGGGIVAFGKNFWSKPLILLTLIG